MLAIDEGTSSKNSRRDKWDQTLTIDDKADREVYDWNLDSSSSRHLVNDPSLLQELKHVNMSATWRMLSQSSCHVSVTWYSLW